MLLTPGVKSVAMSAPVTSRVGSVAAAATAGAAWAREDAGALPAAGTPPGVSACRAPEARPPVVATTGEAPLAVALVAPVASVPMALAGPFAALLALRAEPGPPLAAARLAPFEAAALGSSPKPAGEPGPKSADASSSSWVVLAVRADCTEAPSRRHAPMATQASSTSRMTYSSVERPRESRSRGGRAARPRPSSQRRSGR